MARRKSKSTNISENDDFISAGQGVSQEIEINTLSTETTNSETIMENLSLGVSDEVRREESESSISLGVNSFDLDMGNSVNTNTASSRSETTESVVGSSQTLTIDGNQISISNGNTIELPQHDDVSHETYTHDQGMPSTLWSIVHNLGKSPSVTIVDSSGEIVDGKVIYVDSNQINIEFNAGFSGLAYLN